MMSRAARLLAPKTFEVFRDFESLGYVFTDRPLTNFSNPLLRRSLGDCRTRRTAGLLDGALDEFRE